MGWSAGSGTAAPTSGGGRRGGGARAIQLGARLGGGRSVRALPGADRFRMVWSSSRITRSEGRFRRGRRGRLAPAATCRGASSVNGWAWGGSLVWRGSRRDDETQPRLVVVAAHQGQP